MSPCQLASGLGSHARIANFPVLSQSKHISCSERCINTLQSNQRIINMGVLTTVDFGHTLTFKQK